MKNKVSFYFLFLLLILAAFNFSGCSKLSGPSDQDVIKAVNESGLFRGGQGQLTLQQPIVILEKGDRNKDGSWPVKAKVTFTTYVAKDKISAPETHVIIFNMYKTKDNAGQLVWIAKLGS